MSKSVNPLNWSNVLTPSAYSKQVNLWCENVGLDWLLTLKSVGSVYTVPDSLPSKIVNCQN